MFSLGAADKELLDKQAISNFREYLQIPSVHPNINYDPCIDFLERQARELSLPFQIFEVFPRKPVVVISYIGREPDLPSILLNSHMDVVPVFEESWTHKPFSADVDEHNNIYARGSQDMKCVGIQCLETVRRLKQQEIVLKRTIHVSFVPDEEIGGIEGMGKFVQTEDFEMLNVGFSLDEGVTSPTEEFAIFYAERATWQIHIHCPGNSGHGSTLLDNTAGEKLSKILQKFYSFRQQEKDKLTGKSFYESGHVTSVNLTRIMGGVQSNVIPEEFVAVFDCRISPQMKNFDEIVDEWCREAGAGVWVEYELKCPHTPATKIDESNPYWVAFKQAADDMALKLRPMICPGATDNRYVRGKGIPAIGFSPINNTPILLHAHDEYLGVETFLRGIEIYCNVLISIANI